MNNTYQNPQYSSAHQNQPYPPPNYDKNYPLYKTTPQVNPTRGNYI